MQQQKKYLHYLMLKLSEQESLKEIEQVIQKYFESDTSGHGFDHIKRVVKHTTLFLCDFPDADAFVSLCIAYFHDVFDYKINKVDNVEEALLDYMDSLPIDFHGKEPLIARGASQIGYSIRHQVSDKLVEAMIVSDADYMDALGPFGIIRTFQYGFLHDHSIDEMVEHLSEKLLTLEALLTSDTAKKMARKRHQLLFDFYTIYQEDKL